MAHYRHFRKLFYNLFSLYFVSGDSDCKLALSLCLLCVYWTKIDSMFVKDDGKTSQLKCDKVEIERLMQLLHESYYLNLSFSFVTWLNIWLPVQSRSLAAGEVNIFVDSEFSGRRPWSWAAISSPHQEDLLIHKSLNEEQLDCILKIICLRKVMLPTRFSKSASCQLILNGVENTCRCPNCG